MARFIVIIFALLMPNVKAFDPEPNYVSHSIESTVNSITKIVIPGIKFPNGQVDEVVRFLEIKGDVPKSHRVHFILEGFADLSKVRVKVVEKNITKLDVLTKIAEQIGADIVIKPGKVILRKRTIESEQVGPGQPPTRSEFE